jgi:hypothetical protein
VETTKFRFGTLAAVKNCTTPTSASGPGCVKTQISNLRVVNCYQIAWDIGGKVCFSGIIDAEESHLEEILHQQ